MLNSSSNHPVRRGTMLNPRRSRRWAGFPASPSCPLLAHPWTDRRRADL